MPAVTLQQLIPKRSFVTKEEQPTASQVFQAQVQSAAKQLATDYHKVRLTAHSAKYIPYNLDCFACSWAMCVRVYDLSAMMRGMMCLGAAMVSTAD